MKIKFNLENIIICFNDSLPPRALPLLVKTKKPTGLKRPVGVEMVGATVLHHNLTDIVGELYWILNWQSFD